MTAEYNVEVDRDAIKEAISLFEFVGGNSADALRIAANKAAAKTRTLASRTIREQLRLKAGYVGEQLALRRATRANLSAVISSRKFGILMSRYHVNATIAEEGKEWDSAPRAPISGIRVKVKPSGASIVFKGDDETTGLPFYMVLKNSNRLGIAARRKTPTALGSKIKVFHGPSVSQAFNSVRDDIRGTATGEFEFQLLDAMRYLLVKQYPQEA